MLVRQLTKQLSTSLNSALSGVSEAIARVLIDLSPTSNGFYLLGSEFMATGDKNFFCRGSYQIITRLNGGTAFVEISKVSEG